MKSLELAKLLYRRLDNGGMHRVPIFTLERTGFNLYHEYTALSTKPYKWVITDGNTIVIHEGQTYHVSNWEDSRDLSYIMVRDGAKWYDRYHRGIKPEGMAKDFVGALECLKAYKRTRKPRNRTIRKP